jgi:hypothetical protein
MAKHSTDPRGEHRDVDRGLRQHPLHGSGSAPADSGSRAGHADAVRGRLGEPRRVPLPSAIDPPAVFA